MEPAIDRTKAAIKAVMLVVFIIASVVVVRFTPAGEALTAERLGAVLEAAGLWAPLAFILAYTVGVCLFIPAILLTTVGAALFGPLYGFIYVWLGAMGGSSAAFFIGRYLGRDFAVSVVGNRLKKYDDAIRRNGFAAVLYLRLIYFPFTPMNFGMGLTSVKFRDYFAGTALGIVAGTFIFTFFIGSFKEIWVSGRWEELLSWKILASIGLFVFSFFIPKLIKLAKPMHEGEEA